MNRSILVTAAAVAVFSGSAIADTLAPPKIVEMYNDENGGSPAFPGDTTLASDRERARAFLPRVVETTSLITRSEPVPAPSSAIAPRGVLNDANRQVPAQMR